MKKLNNNKYKNYLVFESVEELKMYNQEPTKEDFENKVNQLFKERYETLYHAEYYYAEDLKRKCKTVAKEYFKNLQIETQKELDKKATETDKAFIVYYDSYQGHGDFHNHTEGAFVSKEVALEAIEYYKELGFSETKFYIKDQEGNKVFGKGAEEEYYESDELQA